MDSITVSDYRCFGESPQTARLAPITLFVGENSTGKTSLLAMIRALWDAAFADRVPDFKEAPYDLGTFDEILYRRAEGASSRASFTASCEVRPHGGDEDRDSQTLFKVEEVVTPFKVEVEFGSQWSAPMPVRRRISRGEHWVEQCLHEDDRQDIYFGVERNIWKVKQNGHRHILTLGRTQEWMPPLLISFLHLSHGHGADRPAEFADRVEGTLDLTGKLIDDIFRMVRNLPNSRWPMVEDISVLRPFSGAPIRSQPRRTYDPARVTPEAEGDSVAMRFAWLSLHDEEAWKRLKKRLESFGSTSGLFDEILLRRLGETASDPFQIQVWKSADSQDRRAFPLNLVDVGYGVSQILPLAAELLREDSYRTMLLQQPEVHLHPSAAAELGTLLCEVAASDEQRQRRIIVETHSDFIIDRVVTAVRDGVSGLEPDDVSIVYFERRGHEVRLHSMGVDRSGNLTDVPPGYRDFFMAESDRFLGL